MTVPELQNRCAGDELAAGSIPVRLRYLRKRPAVEVRALLTQGVKPGSIVSMHFGHSGTADVISGILDGLDGKGLKAVTTSALLGVA